jgi:hypothetical protein
MIRTLRSSNLTGRLRTTLAALLVLLAAAYLGRRPSIIWLALMIAIISGVALLALPVLGLPVLVLASLVLPLEIGTGTDVKLNLAALLIPALFAIWVLDRVRRRSVRIARTRANVPLLLFLAASLFSLLIGRATWDPMVPVGDNFLLVQLAQWAIFAFSALAFWLAGNLIKDQRWLWRLTAIFFLIGGGLAILQMLPGGRQITASIATIAIIRAPFWVLLTALAAGQLLFSRSLSIPWRVFLVLAVGASLFYAFVSQQDTASNWVGLTAALGTLTWLRFPRLRWAVVLIIVILLALGQLAPTIYQFAGGDTEWTVSGGSRVVLIQRVIEVTMRNPVTGLGPAAYRLYAGMKPLGYQNAFWITPRVNSHNNYVDLFAHGGMLGLLLFFWFAWEIARLGVSLRKRYAHGFSSGYVNGMLAAGVGALVIMAFADWILPFVYNIGFAGFQASVLLWLFMGGLVALENLGGGETERGRGGD